MANTKASVDRCSSIDREARARAAAGPRRAGAGVLRPRRSALASGDFAGCVEKGDVSARRNRYAGGAPVESVDGTVETQARENFP
jgi:hypothetical protein